MYVGTTNVTEKLFRQCKSYYHGILTFSTKWSNYSSNIFKQLMASCLAIRRFFIDALLILFIYLFLVLLPSFLFGSVLGVFNWRVFGTMLCFEHSVRNQSLDFIFSSTVIFLFTWCILSVNLISIFSFSVFSFIAMMLFEETEHFASIVYIWIVGLIFSCIIKMYSKFLRAFIP